MYDVTSYLAAWSYVPSGDVSVPGPMFLWVSLSGGLCPGESLSKGSLSL